MARKVEEESMYDELVRVTKRKPKASEPLEDFTLEILRKCQKLSDDAWNSLREETQKWVNAQTELDNDGKDFALLEPGDEVEADRAAASKRGVEAAEAEDEASSASEDQEDEEMAKTATARKTATKGKQVAAKSTARRKTNGDGGRGRQGSYSLDAKITILAKDNPKRQGTAGYDRFAKLKKGMTVREALAAGVLWVDLRYDVNKGNIAIK